MNPLNPQQQEQQQQQRQSGQQPGAPSLMQFPGMAYPAGPWFDPGVFGLPAAVPTQSSVRSASPSHTHSGGTPSFSGLGKSRSAVDLSSWDPASEMDFGDSGMGEMGRPRKMSKSVSMGNLAGWNDSPPDSDGSGGAKLGPLGHPIRLINTFATKLPTFEEVEERAAEGGYASDHLTPRKNGNQGEGEGDDLVAQLMEPSTSQMEHDYSMDLLT
ncbi:hypothetical protein APUTEX25_000257 [Auxenochlorella protothecoides]|uniref:Uncharacterized protein n=1 Tax=Auxenochlorella protothecoides TaxID=3075 RepID=A0A3M7L0R7_AUXPR|nr:hypothetical protein APUTEX25_000257 [Auxenochlorella protothecoides]|eukprot:RMZ55674.1 hypothetical protein APUTEX25_000257 [Auxenochlorella protothecoides]